MDRVCKECGVEKPIEKFSLSRGCRHHTCKICIGATKKRHRGTPEGRAAHAAQASKFRATHKASIALQQNAYNKTPEGRNRRNAARKRFNAKHRNVIALKKHNWCEALTDGYIKQRLASASSLTSKDIPQALVEVKRLQIQIQRMIKNEKC